MSSTRLLTIGVLLTALTACSGAKTLEVPATVDGQDPARVIALIQASERVLVRRLAAAEVKNAVVSVAPVSGNNAMVTIKLADGQGEDDAMRIMSDPFTFDIRLETGTRKNDEGIDETDWTPTGITGEDVVWIQPIRNSETGELGVEVQLTDEGRDKLATAFGDNNGKNIGIFVRDLLVSKMNIGNGTVGDSIVISGIPSARIAEIFADDVNVGLHVHFSVSQ